MKAFLQENLKGRRSAHADAEKNYMHKKSDITYHRKFWQKLFSKSYANWKAQKEKDI